MSHQKMFDLLTVNQFADELGVTVATVRAWVLRRQIAFLKVGRSIRIERSTLQKLVEDSRVPAKTA